MARASRLRFRTGGKHSAGFTLLEVLVALAVIAVAATVSISLFSSSTGIMQRTRAVRAAASLAGERLALIQNAPAAYTWPPAGELAGGQLLEIIPADGSPDVVSHPAAMPVYPAAGERESNFYDRFTWEAFARLQTPESPFYEVVVVIRWKDDGRPYSYSITSAIPRSAVGANG